MASSSLYIRGFRIISPRSPYTTEGMPARSSTAGFTRAASFLGAVSARNTAVRIPIGTPRSTASAVPIIDVRITYRIPKDGFSAVGFHAVPKRISLIPTRNRAGAPFITIYTVMEITANMARNAHRVNITCAISSTADLFFRFPWMEKVCCLFKMITSL